MPQALTGMPVITATTAFVPAGITLHQWREMQRDRVARPPAGWAPRLWRPWFDEYGLRPDSAVAGEQDPDGCRQPDGLRIPVEPRLDLSGLAARVTVRLLAARPAGTRAPDVIIFCHSTLNEHVTTTTAGRLCRLTGGSAFAFSISQQGDAAVFTALRLACDLLAAEPGLASVLIVAAEKWLPPFERSHCADPTRVHGDAAGALLLERATRTTRGLAVLGTETAGPACAGTATPTGDSNADRDAPRRGPGFAGQVDTLIESLLVRHRISAGDISHAIGQPEVLTGPVRNRLLHCLPHSLPRGLPHRAAGAASSCEFDTVHPILRLVHLVELRRFAGLRDGRELPAGSLVLAWGSATAGFAGCTLLQVRAGPAHAFSEASSATHPAPTTAEEWAGR